MVNTLSGRKIAVGILLVFFIAFFSLASKAQNLVQYVQTLSGTAPATTPASIKHGGGTELNANTIPAVTRPFAMTQWTPQTRTTEKKCLPPYFYKDSLFTGIRGSHWLSGSCTQDYGSFTIMPVAGPLQTTPANYAVRFDHANEETSPYAYRLQLKDKGIIAQVAATERCAVMQFTIEKADSFYLLVTPNSDFGEGYIKIDEAKREIVGYNPVHRIYQGWGKQAGFNGYFVIKIEQVFSTTGTYSGNKLFASDSIMNKPDVGAFVGFNVKKGDQVRLRIGTSFSSLKGARANLEKEIASFDFDKVALEGKLAWQKALEQVRVKTRNDKDKRIFYTALYHAMQHPRLFNDADGTYPAFSSHYQLKKIDQGNYYDDMSVWDIYRAQLPLFEILNPVLINDVVHSLILKGQQGGWMPIFPCWNSYTAAMIGDHTSSVIASAYQKGIRNYDANEAYRLLYNNAFKTPQNHQDYIDGKGRRALTSYIKYGYIPLEDSVQDAFHKKEQVSRTLEYAYDDYAVAQLAKGLGKTSDYDILNKRSKNYKNVFDKRVGLVRGRYANGTFVSAFNPDKKEFFITEGTPRQYTFYVPHDVEGLAALMGGKDKLEQSLDSLFLRGEYWHGNEPGHQIPFMYNYTNAAWKTQEKVQQILNDEYSDGPGGLSGNDDAGQMSAWYVFSAMGIYPVNPVSGMYQVSTPIFDEINIKVSPQKSFKIRTHKASDNSKYIHTIKLNGKVNENRFISYADIMRGGIFEIFLTDKPDTK